MPDIKCKTDKNGNPRYQIYLRRAHRWFPIARAKAEAMLANGEAVAYDPKAENIW